MGTQPLFASLTGLKGATQLCHFHCGSRDLRHVDREFFRGCLVVARR
jgi:hypothetical protein